MQPSRYVPPLHLPQNPTHISAIEPTNIIVIGGGVAGLSAVVEILTLHRSNTSPNKPKVIVTLFDDKKLHGNKNNSQKASSGVNVPFSPPSNTGNNDLLRLEDAGVDDRVKFVEDTMRSGRDGNDLSLVTTLAYYATPNPQTIQTALKQNSQNSTLNKSNVDIDSTYHDYIKESHSVHPNATSPPMNNVNYGVKHFIEKTLFLELNKVVRLGGHSVERTWSNDLPPNIGCRLVDALWVKILELTECDENDSSIVFKHLEQTVNEIVMSNEICSIIHTSSTDSSEIDYRLCPPTVINRVIAVRVTEISNDVLNIDRDLSDVEYDTDEVEGEVVIIPHRLHCTSPMELAVECEYSLRANAVIVATGGFGSNTELIRLHAPNLSSNLPNTGSQTSNGSGLELVKALGGALVDVDCIQLHPTAFIDPDEPDAQHKLLAPEALRGVGGLLLSCVDGCRFVNELDTRDKVVEAAFLKSSLGSDGEDEKVAEMWLLLTNDMVNDFGVTTFEFYLSKGLFIKFESENSQTHKHSLVSDVADYINCSSSQLSNTIEAYCKSSCNNWFHEVGCMECGNYADEFGKTSRPNLKSLQNHFLSPNTADSISDRDANSRSCVYLARVTPAIHYTMGGVSINSKAEVLSCSNILLNSKSQNPLTPSEVNIPASETSTGLEETFLGGGGGTFFPPASMLIDSTMHRNSDIIDGLELFRKPLLHTLPGVYAAGEVAGGVHGKNRMGGNSLLEGVVFGRIAGERALSHTLSNDPPLSKAVWTALTLRESVAVCDEFHLYRFDLKGAMQSLGGNDLHGGCGQYLECRALIDDEEVIRYYSPVSRPEVLGYFDLLIKLDSQGGPISSRMKDLEVGMSLEFKGPFGQNILNFSRTPTPSSSLPHYDEEGGAARMSDAIPIGVSSSSVIQSTLGLNRNVTKIGLIAGGGGIAPMIQIIRSVFAHRRDDIQIQLLYGGNTPTTLPFYSSLLSYSQLHSNFHMHTTVLSLDQSSSWDSSWGYITPSMITKCFSATHEPSENTLIVVCGPPKMCKIMKRELKLLGYGAEMVFSWM